MTRVGLIKAILFVVLSGFYNVFVRFAVAFADAKPYAFACLSLMFSAVALYVLAGHGKIARDSLIAPASWVYGIVLAAAYIVDAYFLQFVTATEAGLFSRLAIPLILLVTLVRRTGKPKLSEFLSAGLICICLVVLSLAQTSREVLVIIGLAGIAAALQLLHFLIAEHHPQGVQSRASDWRDEARVVAITTGISASVFALMGVIYILTIREIDTSVDSANVGTHLSIFLDTPTILSAAFFGILFLPAIRFLKWSATGAVGTMRLFSLMAAVPLLTVAIELAFNPVAAKLLGLSNAARMPDEFSVLLAVAMTVSVLLPNLLQPLFDRKQAASSAEV